MRMNRIAVVPASAILAVSALTACGSDDKATDAASNAAGSAKSAGSSATDSASSAGSSATDKASAGASSSDSSNASDGTQCPTGDNTKNFAKTRFVANVGLAAGTFKHWIYDPYNRGSFKKGHVDKSDAVKAALTAAGDYKLLKNAKEDAMASPALCKAVGKPLDEALDKIKNVDKSQLLMGNVGGLMGAQTALQSVISGSKSQGADVQETTDISKSDAFSDTTKKLLGAAK